MEWNHSVESFDAKRNLFTLEMSDQEVTYSTLRFLQSPSESQKRLRPGGTQRSDKTEEKGTHLKHLDSPDSYVLAKSLQSCSTLCDPMDCSPPGSSVHGISQGRIPEWVAIFSSRGCSRPRDWTCISYGSYTVSEIFYHWATGRSPLMDCQTFDVRNKKFYPYSRCSVDNKKP